jgi:branched-chain amino acid transport system permease protein
MSTTMDLGISREELRSEATPKRQLRGARSAALLLAATLGTGLVAWGCVQWLDVPAQLKGVLWVTFAICALSLNLVWGQAGIFSFGQTAFFGVGAYGYAITSLNLAPLSGETVSAVAGGVLLAAVSAAGLGYVLFRGRLSDVYLAIITLAVTLMLYTVLSSTAGPEWHLGAALLGGFNGIPSLPPLTLPWLGSPPLELNVDGLLVACASVLGFIVAGVWLLGRSKFGASLRGVRENELRMELLGFNVVHIKLAAFTLGGAIAGLGGALYAAWGTFVNPAMFGIGQAALVVIWVMVGGRGYLFGPLLGVLIVQSVSDHADDLVAQQTPLALGLVLIGVVLFFPKGLAGGIGSAWARWVPGSKRRPARRGLQWVVRDGQPRVRKTANGASELRVQDIEMRFGGNHVLRGLSTSLGAKGIVAIVGSNGAGKSTLFGVLSGRHRATAGRVWLGGSDVTGLAMYERARRGIGTKTQVPNVFPELTVRGNLEIAMSAPGTDESGWVWAEEMLSHTGLSAKLDDVVAELAHGEQQWLEIAMVLASDPAVVLLDEPAAGLTQTERQMTLQLVRRLGETRIVVVIEHDMAFVRALSSPVLAMHQGQLLRSGTFDEVCADPAVQQSYLGKAPHVVER